MELNSLAKKVLLALALVAGGAAIGRYTLPTKVVTRVEEKVVEKEVVRTKDTSTKDTQKNRELVVTETILPDGTRKIEKHYINRDVVKEDTTRINNTTTDRSTEKKSETITTNEKNNWNVSALVSMSHRDDDLLKGSPSYGLAVQRRILGPFSIGAFGLTNQTYGASVGVSF